MKFDLLKSSQISENDNSIFEKYGMKAALTDFSILLGAFISTASGSSFSIEDGKTGCWWVKELPTPFVIDYSGCYKVNSVEHRDIGFRPSINYSEIKSNCLECDSNYGVKEVLYGEYPQTIVDKDTSLKLNKLYNSSSLKSTGKRYTTDSIMIHNKNEEFEPMDHIEYEYKGNKYIRFIADDNSKNSVLSNGEKIELGHAYWIKVEPISWLVDEKNNIAVSKKILFAGIQFRNAFKNKYDFDSSDIKMFLDKYFSKDIIPSKILNKENKQEKTKNQLLEEYVELLKLKNSLIEQSEKVDNEIELVRLKLVLSKNRK